MTSALGLAVGARIFGRAMTVTAERIRWYGAGMLTAATGELREAQSNIHTDVDYAQKQGLSTAIADGMMSTAWISSMLLRAFGRDYLESGELRTKYIKTTDLGVRLKVLGEVVDRKEQEGGAVRFALNVWTEDESGRKLTDGDAVVVVHPNR